MTSPFTQAFAFGWRSPQCLFSYECCGSRNIRVHRIFVLMVHDGQRHRPSSLVILSGLGVGPRIASARRVHICARTPWCIRLRSPSPAIAGVAQQCLGTRSRGVSVRKYHLLIFAKFSCTHFFHAFVPLSPSFAHVPICAFLSLFISPSPCLDCLACSLALALQLCVLSTIIRRLLFPSTPTSWFGFLDAVVPSMIRGLFV